jgi:hypothetical protein
MYRYIYIYIYIYIKISFNTAVMHKVPTYDELVRDTITDPKDRIAVPNIMATQLRNTPQLTKFDEQDKITKERIKEIEIRNLASTTNKYYNTTTVNKAMYEGPSTTPGPPPPGPPPPASKPQMKAAGTQTVLKPTQTQSSGSGDPYFSCVGRG